MNKFSIMIKGVTLAMSLIGIAHAEWTGLYAGADAGFALNKAKLKSQQLGFTNQRGKCNINSNSFTFIPGAQLGYLYQFANNLVSGIEANVTYNTNQKDKLSCRCPFYRHVSDDFSLRDQMQSAIKARMGTALNWNGNIYLPYLTAGASFANVALTYKNEGGDYYSKKATKSGLLIGAGIEWYLWQHWSLRTEYDYVDYGKAIHLKIPSVYDLRDPNGKARIGLSSGNIVVAINYWI